VIQGTESRKAGFEWYFNSLLTWIKLKGEARTSRASQEAAHPLSPGLACGLPRHGWRTWQCPEHLEMCLTHRDSHGLEVSGIPLPTTVIIPINFYNLFFEYLFSFTSVSANSLERPESLELSALTFPSRGKAPGSVTSRGSPGSPCAGRPFPEPELCCIAEGLRSHWEHDWLLLFSGFVRVISQ